MMIVSGFTFVRNGVTNGYPFEESIRSILPIVDEFICVVGKGDDQTRKLVTDIGDNKIRVIDSCWNEKMRDRGFVYGQQKMIAQYNCSGDWAFYLEADEVLHETELDKIYDSMKTNLDNNQVEALYFDFLHFYGTPWQTGIAGYRKAPRIIRNCIRTIAPDGLFWLVLDKNKKGRYPRAKATNAHIYHYGHCRSVERMNQKLQQIGKYWGQDHAVFEGYGDIDTAELKPFSGSHPSVMELWLKHHAEHEFVQTKGYKLSKRDIRNRIRFWIEEVFDLEISKKHFRRLV